MSSYRASRVLLNVVEFVGDSGEVTAFDPSISSIHSDAYKLWLAAGNVIGAPIDVPPAPVAKADKAERLIALLLAKGQITPADAADLRRE